MSNSTFDVFISYSHLDVEWVRDWLLPRLEAAGLRVCIDSRDFAIGAPSLVNMENAAEHSRKTLLILTPRWLQSEWTKFESLLIQAEDPSGVQRRTLPLLLEKCQLPKRLAIFTHADFTDSTNWENELKRVIAAIREAPAPAPPNRQDMQPNLVHPYALQANFTGRVSERKELSAWLADDAHPICALIAMGGMGKSALAWYWMMHDVLPASNLMLDGVMWWSFYEGESSFAKFIDEALKYVSGQPIDATLFPTTYDRAQELRRQLQNKRVLIILDGFERLMRQYANLDAAYQPDDTTNPSREERACVDPIVARLLSYIAAGTTRAKMLLTTRLMVSDLEDSVGYALAGVLKRELKELPRDDAVVFMRAQGVTKGIPTEIANACEEYSYHPLSLRLLSGLIARDTRTPGDIAAAPRHDVYDDLVQRQHHILEQSYNALDEEERALISRIAAFRSPMTYDALSIFNEFDDEAKFEDALNDLQARGLLQRDIAHNRYDLHPIVRHYAYDRLTDKTSVHTRLRDYFAKFPVPNEDEVQSIEDLATIIELYHHMVHAGQYDEALDLLSVRLVPNPLHYRFGAYQLMIDLKRALFPDGEDHPPRLKNEHDQAWALNALANSYAKVGQSHRAIPLFERLNMLLEMEGDKENLASGLENICNRHIELGELAAAEKNLTRAIELSRETKDEFGEAIEHVYLGRLLAYRGVFDEAARELETALSMFEKQRRRQGIGVAWVYCALLALLMSDAQGAFKAAQTIADEVAKARYPFVRDIIRAEWLLGAALVIGGKDLNAAAKHLTEALTRCRRINLVELEPDILLTLARWHRARRNAQEAQTYAEEALAIADRCEFRLKQAEIHNFLARLSLDAGDSAAARQHAETAHERAWCDGPPYCYKPALDEAEGMLRELGAEENA
jgi:tetratricopeptide (TPR) repeat protein